MFTGDIYLVSEALNLENCVKAKTSVWWDIENCEVPRGWDAHVIALNVSSALLKTNYCGLVSIWAYGDTNFIPLHHQQALSSTGVALNHIPAVVYRNALWKAEIGQWFSSCDAVAKEVDIIEPIGERKCMSDCSGQGVCNHEFGLCRCFHGFTDCLQNLRLDCNYEKTPEMPYGKWVVLICSRHCDTTRTMCFCGEGTKYPNRPVPESCGFQINSQANPDEPKMTDWSKPDLDILCFFLIVILYFVILCFDI
ncbi:NYN domain limkain-b1-type [Arabidopsis thaliana x Arabidopsis arenosa]|uniref:NYN domain limkain-b1-type n=1 Tax=Arabidopsis thaliana x Arabidopsis arenosa TaxID=1240361 RepID=A0A8T2FXR8_9BRAS|nr:NYN domain limkain-b1-type [Arabidopsis thaliana x Arabidopsis arenosa]